MASVLHFVNSRGIPCIESTGVTLTATAATFTFPQYLRSRLFRAGGIFIRIRPEDTFTPPGTAVPIQFATTGVANSAIEVLGADFEPITTTEWSGPGIKLVFYDPVNNQLSLVNEV